MPSETIELRGHIIDSLILPKVLDEIIARGSTFKIGEIRIGEQRTDQSFARIEVTASGADELDQLILRLGQHGAEVMERKSVQMAAAPADGVYPQGFYVTTNQQTFVQLEGREVEVQPALMDSAIVVDLVAKRAQATKFYGVKKGMEIVVGHQGIRVVPLHVQFGGDEFLAGVDLSTEEFWARLLAPGAPFPTTAGAASVSAPFGKVEYALQVFEGIPGISSAI